MIRPLCIAVFSLGLALPASAQSVPLNQNQHITESLVAGRAGDVLRKTCPSISARMFTVYSKMEALKRYALAQGYTEPQVRAFLDDPVEKARIRRLATEYLAKAGAKPGDVESHCVAGRAEIAKGTLMGSLLRSSK